MAEYQKRRLSESTSGKNIKIVATATAGTLIHTAIDGTDANGNQDEIWLFAVNTSTSDVLLTIEFGGTTSPDDLVPVTIPAKGTTALDGENAVIRGRVLQGGLEVRAFAASANVINVYGYVNRVTQ